ncbi:MAG: hypothetical protein HYT37_02135 [Candidatus Sungbacteria bacterium]|nr:hypothetical protein [Candidatus Sungbacteria bacterium]
MKVSIYSIQNTLYEGDAEKLIIKTPMGEIAVLENHLPIVSKVIGPSAKIIDKNKKEHTIKLSSGFIEVRHQETGGESRVVILAEGEK